MTRLQSLDALRGFDMIWILGLAFVSQCSLADVRMIRVATDEDKVATDVSRELGVETVDLYAVGERNYDKQPDGAHYNDAGTDLLAAAVSAAVQSALKQRKQKGIGK